MSISTCALASVTPSSAKTELARRRLMKIVAGVYRSDSGSIFNDSPRQARERGISMIHQELNLSVGENIFLCV